MAIYRRDRHFQNMMSEIEVETIPLRFVRNVNCVLHDGTTVVLGQSDFDEDCKEDLESMIKDLEFFEAISDLRISIDFDKVEADVSEHVTQILKRIDDQSNPSV